MNVGVRVAEHRDGTILILAAFCPTCRKEALTHTTGRCNWCGRMIVDEHTLSAREMLAQIHAGRLARLVGEAGEFLDALSVAGVRGQT